MVSLERHDRIAQGDSLQKIIVFGIEAQRRIDTERTSGIEAGVVFEHR